MRPLSATLFHGYDASRGLRTSFNATPSTRGVGGLPREVTSPSFFFSESLALASAFARERAGVRHAAVVSAALNVRRPLDLTAKRDDIESALWDTRALDHWPDLPSRRERWTLLDDEAFVREVRAAGYDAAIVDERDLAEMLGITDPVAFVSWAVFDRRDIRVMDPQVPLWPAERR